jgi:hypothetical protein
VVARANGPLSSRCQRTSPNGVSRGRMSGPCRTPKPQQTSDSALSGGTR